MGRAGKVFGIGLSKTGTTSLYAALERLGYRTATFGHMRRLGLDAWFAGDFSRDYLATFNAVTDLPIGTYFRELDARYPGSKFILTVRDVDPWVESIARQFSANPDPAEPFTRTVRLAQYGVTTFNEPRFRRIYAEHVTAVRDYFRDRPDDLLELNLFAGQGWQELCSFLGKPAPDEPFPSVKPGYRTAARVVKTEAPVFAFVMPVVHPDGPKINDYKSVEAVLELTVRSLLRQSHSDVHVVVVCHRAPEWATELGKRVHFLTLGNLDGFEPNRSDVQIDKGMKYLIGSAFALDRLKATHVMLTDADDFAQVELVETLSGPGAPPPGRDGWIVTRGYHAALRKTQAGFQLLGTFPVREFDRSCGSCRIFLGASLEHQIAGVSEGILRLAEAMSPSDVTQPVPLALASHVVEITLPVADQPDSLQRLLGRHVRQAPFLDLARVAKPLMAKGCGHGNHDGPRKGEIHWDRVTGVADSRRFAETFGLDDMRGISVRPDPGLAFRGGASALANALRGRRRRRSQQA